MRVGLKPWYNGIVRLVARKKERIKLRKSIDLAIESSDIEWIYFELSLMKMSQFRSDMSISQG